MAGRPRTRARGLALYTWLRDHRDEAMSLAELVTRAPGNYTPGDTTRRALAHAAALAEADGLCLRVPCHENGYTYMLTTAPLAIEPSARWLGKVESGVSRRRRMHTSVMAANLDQLPEDQRAAMEAQLRVEAELDTMAAAAQRVAEASAAALSAALQAGRTAGP